MRSRINIYHLTVKLLEMQFIRFLGAGFFNTITSYIIYCLCLLFMPYIYAYIIYAYICVYVNVYIYAYIFETYAYIARGGGSAKTQYNIILAAGRRPENFHDFESRLLNKIISFTVFIIIMAQNKNTQADSSRAGSTRQIVVM